MSTDRETDTHEGPETAKNLAKTALHGYTFRLCDCFALILDFRRNFGWGQPNRNESLFLTK